MDERLAEIKAAWKPDMDGSAGTMRVDAEEACELFTEIERLEAAATISTEGLLALTELFNAERAEVKQLDAAKDILAGQFAHACTANKLCRAEGMEAAVVLIKARHDRLDVGSNCEIEAQGWLLQSLIGEVLAAAKQLAGEADSRETFSPASPSPESASPVDLPYTHCVQCGVLIDTRENDTPGCELSDGRWVCSREHWEIIASEMDEANANNAAHRDGGYKKETK